MGYVIVVAIIIEIKRGGIKDYLITRKRKDKTWYWKKKTGSWIRKNKDSRNKEKIGRKGKNNYCK